MPDGILIAIVSSCGVVAVGFIQWMSNRTTVKAAAQRESALKDQQVEQLRLEREERQKERDHALALAAQEREHLLRQAEADHSRTTRDRWRETRVEVYESTLSATNALNRLAGEMFAELHLNKDAETFQDKNTAFVNCLGGITSTRARVDLYGSELFGNKLSAFTMQAIYMSAQGSSVQAAIENGQSVSNEVASTMSEYMKRLMSASDELKSVAKTDLGTIN